MIEFKNISIKGYEQVVCFTDSDVGLQGDMNDDDELNILDVVMMVDIIMSGGMGDVGDLLNIVRG